MPLGRFSIPLLLFLSSSTRPCASRSQPAPPIPPASPQTSITLILYSAMDSFDTLTTASFESTMTGNPELPVDEEWTSQSQGLFYCVIA